MNMKLKTRLILSYTALSVLLIFALGIVSNFLLKNQFENYMIEKQEERNNAYVTAALTEFQDGKDLSTENFLSLGHNALNEGIVLTIKDTEGREIFCMSCIDNAKCESMLGSMQHTMEERDSGFKGQYTEKSYPIENENEKFGTVTLGYYGPYYLLDSDIRFMDMLNKLFIISGLAFLIIAVALGVLMSARIAKPIAEVTKKTGQIKSGDLNCRIEINSDTKEIDSLITSVNALADTLQTQQALKKRMAGDYAHEFRTPLAAIQSNLECIIDGIFEPSSERLESIRAEILRLSTMVNDIDKIVEMENNSEEIKKEDFRFDELIKQSITTFDGELKEKHLTLTSKLSTCEIYGDRKKLGSVVVNLISNAIKYTDYRGCINVRLEIKKDTAVLSVSDTGIGISQQDIAHIFEHLYRADASRTRETGGYGIGLAVVNAIVIAHNGRIEVESEVDKGSEFIVTLPLKSQ